METNFNIGSLKIVSNPLLEYFKKIQNNLNDNLQLVSDKKVAVNFESIDILKKVSGTLKMIGLLGVNKVLSTVSEGLISVKEAKFDSAKTLAVLEVSSRIVSNVVFYLENLLKGEQDQPTKFYDDYAGLCKLLGKDHNIKDLFSPKLDVRNNINAELQADLRVGAFVNAGNKEKLIEILKNNHEVAQTTVVALYEALNEGKYVENRDKEVYQNHIKTLYSLLDVNQKLNLSKNIYLTTALQKLFVAVVSPVFNDNFESLAQKDLNEIKLNLGKIERSSKQILDSVIDLDETDKTGALKAEEDVVREVLYFLINVLSNPANSALKSMPVFQELNEVFDFEYYAKQLSQTTVEVSLAQRAPEIAAQIDKLFVEVKEELGLLTSKQAANEDFAQQHATKFINNINKMSDLMNVVTTPKLKELISLVSSTVSSIKNKQFKFSETLQKEISLSLVLIEYGINNLVRSIASETQKEGFEVQASLQVTRLTLAVENKDAQLNSTPMPVLDAGSQKSDERKAFLVIFEKLHKDLKKSEEILNDIFRDTSNTEDLDQVFKTLNSAKGIFSIINKNELSKLLTNIIAIWKKVGSDGFDAVNSKELLDSVSVLSGILLFIEASKNDNEIEANEMYDRIISRFKVAQVEPEHKPLNLPTENVQVYETQPNEEISDLDFLPPLESDVEIMDLNDIPDVSPVESLEDVFVEDIPEPEVQEVTKSTSSFVDKSDDADLTEVYLMEAEEVLENISKSTDVLEKDLQNSNEITNIRRYFHTLKGSGRMVGLVYLGEVAWMIEQTANKIISGDTELTPKMLADIVTTKNQFDDWVQELKQTESVGVDLVSFKQMWLAHNSHLTTQIEIPDAAVEPVEEIAVQEPENEPLEFSFEDESEEVVEPVEPVQKDTTTVNGVEVSSTLFQLFREECETHLQALRSATHSHNAKVEGFKVTKDFMRHAHTLASICKSVNMDVFSDLVVKVEFIANAAIEKQLVLNESEFNVLESAVNNLDVFADVTDGSLADNQHYQDISDNLDSLLNKVTNIPEEIAPEEPVRTVEKATQSTAAPVDINELVSAISLNIAELFKSNLNSLKDSLESVKEEVNSIKKDNAADTKPAIDVDSLISSINDKVVGAVNAQYEKLNAVLKSKDAAEQENSNKLVNRISTLTNELEVLNKNQANIEKTQRENHEAIKKDLRYLNYVIKKKHNLSYTEVVSEGEGEIRELLDTDQVELIAIPNESVVPTLVLEDNTNDTDEVADEAISAIASQDVEFSSEEEKEFAALDDLPSDLEEEEKIKNINQNLTQVKGSNSIADFLNNNEYVKTIFEEKVSTVEDELDEEIFEISKMETDEILENVDEIMESINSDVLDLAQNQELKRLLHTLKGSVRMAGANKVGAIGHRLESLLDYSETRHISLFKMKDLLTDELNKISYLLDNRNLVLTKDKANWIDGSYEVEVSQPAVVDTATSTVQDVVEIKTQPIIKREEKQYIRIGANLIDGLINEAGEVRLTRTTLEGMLASNRRSLGDLRSSSDKLGKMLKEIEVQAETQIAARSEEKDTDNFDPLEFDRFTRLQELTRFMNEAVSDVQDTVGSMETFLKTQDGAVVQQAILTNNLLDTLMKVRLLPVDNISDRLYKITRNTAKELGKKVSLELFGEKTEMDRLVLDKIVSPLEHLLRNCIAHGIEEPNERLKKGKSILGKVVITTSVDGNFIVMNIKDDGAGINVDKVRSVGFKKGLLKYDGNYSEQQIIELIFHSGFSTADSISQVSGRGVGMDVVKKEISELGGSIEIKTERDKGTEFNIVLPVAVATNQAMLTKIAGKLVAIPALIVDEVSSLKKDKMQAAYLSGKVDIKGKLLPLYYLGHMLGLTPISQLPELKVYNTLIAITYLGETVVVHVDELQTTSEILIKTMGVHFSKISGVLGATLLGDGRQGLVVNPVMLKNHFEQNIRKLNIFNEGVEEATDKMTGVVTVMVVDDSITVRRATSKVLERYGYNIVLAKDGEDGLEQLQVVIPDIILSDIEMPRMDGFEFAKNVKNTEKYAHIPIVMITSRTADKHKNYAMSLGVDGFLGKPYQEEELIGTIKKLVGEAH